MKWNDRADEPRYILKQDGKTLKILHVKSSDSGLYTCMATFSLETNLHHFQLEVLVPPYFHGSVDDTAVSVAENQTIMLNCTVDGYPVPKVRFASELRSTWSGLKFDLFIYLYAYLRQVVWQKTDLKWPVNKWTLADIAFKTANRQFLVINRVKKEIHAGNYTCLVKNKLTTIQRTFILHVWWTCANAGFFLAQSRIYLVDIWPWLNTFSS